MIPVAPIKRRVIIKRFINEGAIDKNHAVQPSSIGVDQRLVFLRLVSDGIVVDAGNGKYFVDTTKM